MGFGAIHYDDDDESETTISQMYEYNAGLPVLPYLVIYHHLALLLFKNRLQDERESLQFETTDGEEETEGARYSKNELKDRFRNMGDNMQRQVEENAEKITRQENSANVMKELLEVFDGIFEVTEGRG